VCARELLQEEGGRFPRRRTFERRLKALPETLPEQIGCLGRHLVELLRPWERSGRAVALDSTVLWAKGGENGTREGQGGRRRAPLLHRHCEAGWTYSGWHGWVYGWKLHLAVTVGTVWIPLAARLTPANTADNRVAPSLILRCSARGGALRARGHSLRDDRDLREASLRYGRFLVTTKRGPYPHTGAGVEVRRIFHELRSRAIENFNGQFKSIFDGHAQVPTKGLVATARFALGAVLVYQLALLHRYEHERDLPVGLKAFLKAA
jgi:hypothetical protein